MKLVKENLTSTASQGERKFRSGPRGSERRGERERGDRRGRGGEQSSVSKTSPERLSNLTEVPQLRSSSVKKAKP